MLTRAKFLRLSGATAAAALAIAPEAHAKSKSSDGVVRVKSIYGFQETIERLKKDIAAKKAVAVAGVGDDAAWELGMLWVLKGKKVAIISDAMVEDGPKALATAKAIAAKVIQKL